MQKLTILTASLIVYRFNGRPTLRPSLLLALLLPILLFGMLEAVVIS